MDIKHDAIVKTAQVDGIPENPRGLTKRIMDAIQGLKFGYVQITIHDSRIVQIERTEKIRFANDKTAERR